MTPGNSSAVLIIGVTSQAGRLMAKSLMAQGVKVHGTTTKHVDQLGTYKELEGVGIFPGMDYSLEGNRKILMKDLVRGVYGTVYNFASQMYAPHSWEAGAHCLILNTVLPATILDALRISPRRDIVFIQAGSGEMFAHTNSPKCLCSPMEPSNPYGISKAVAFDMIRRYRERYELLASTAVLFNMEAGLRDDFFFARHAIKEVARISIAVRKNRSTRKRLPIDIKPAEFKTINARRDWGLCHEYVEAMQKMAALNLTGKSRDFVICTGETHSCREFLMAAFKHAGVWWETGFKFIEFSHSREGSDDVMLGDAADAGRVLGWKASGFQDVIKELMLEELRSQGAYWLK